LWDFSNNWLNWSGFGGYFFVLGLLMAVYRNFAPALALAAKVVGLSVAEMP
jgi:hypothetical protein